MSCKTISSEDIEKLAAMASVFDEFAKRGISLDAYRDLRFEKAPARVRVYNFTKSFRASMPMTQEIFVEDGNLYCWYRGVVCVSSVTLEEAFPDD